MVSRWSSKLFHYCLSTCSYSIRPTISYMWNKTISTCDLSLSLSLPSHPPPPPPPPSSTPLLVPGVLREVLAAVVEGVKVVDLCEMGDRLILEETSKVYKKEKLKKGK